MNSVQNTTDFEEHRILHSCPNSNVACCFVVTVLFVSTVCGTSIMKTPKLGLGFLEVSFNYLPINGTFFYYPNNIVGNSSNLTSVLKVVMENRSIVVTCNVDLADLSPQFGNHSWLVKWSLSSSELSCNVGDQTKQYGMHYNANLTGQNYRIVFGNGSVSACLSNFKLLGHEDIVQFNCQSQNFANDTNNDILMLPHANLNITAYKVDCLHCADFPTPSPFWSSASRSSSFAKSSSVPHFRRPAADAENDNFSTPFHFNLSTSTLSAVNTTFSNESYLNNFTTDLSTATTAILVDVVTTVTTQESSVCDSQPCQNNGTCRESSNGTDVFSGNSYHCECPLEYYGDSCQHFNACHDDSLKATMGSNKTVCYNGGVCGGAQDDANNGSTKCVCPVGFTGQFCENIISSFATRVFSSTNFSTTTTTTASLASDPCFAQPCRNNGTCTSFGGNFTCLCPPQWDGDSQCSSKRSDVAAPVNCTTKRCDNNGICKPDGSCNCTSTGFTGKFCQDDIDECHQSLPNPCQNSISCNNTIGSYECICQIGFSGKNCAEPAKIEQTTPSPSSSSSTNVGAIVGGIFGALAFVCLVIGGVFFYRYIRRSRKLKGKYNPAKEEMNNAGGSPMPLSTLTTGERLI